MSDETYTRQDLLALSPQQYLAGGYFAGPGDAEPRTELQGTWALASAERLNQARIPDQLLDQALADLQEAGDRLESAKTSFASHLPGLRALARKPAYAAHPVLADLLTRCLAAVQEPRDLAACTAHLDKINGLAALTSTLRDINARLQEERADSPPE